ncbi:MAG: hypothetical protein IPK84_03120 [Candidatus Moraniibacteriota bacterium]|nr:MAG: hypothetical protein IPK84_03120 [Candidatus Moranbacteria bacterium]
MTTTNATRFADSIAQEAQEYLSGVSRIGIPGTWRDLTSTYHLYSPRAHAHGLETAISRLSEEVKVHVGWGVCLPYNYGPKPEWRRQDAPEKVVLAKAEINWILGAAQLATQWPVAAFMFHRFFRDGIDGGNGVNSPYSCLAQIPAGVHSPGALVRRMMKIRAKAWVLMSTSVDGLQPSWAAVAVAAAGKLPVNKAAITVWAMTLKSPRLEGSIVSELRHYRAARNWLSRNLCSAPSRSENFAAWIRGEIQEGSRVETVEGVRAIARPERRVRHGISVQECVEIQTSQDGNPAGRDSSLLVRIGGFAYHQSTSWWRSDYDDPKRQESKVIKRAFEALRRHREALRVEGVSEEIQKMISSGKLEILVTREHSYSAGNCRQGTESFARQHGYVGRLYAPATALLNSGNSRAVAAARVAIRQFMEAMAA